LFSSRRWKKRKVIWEIKGVAVKSLPLSYSQSGFMQMGVADGDIPTRNEALISVFSFYSDSQTIDETKYAWVERMDYLAENNSEEEIYSIFREC
jgi:hypothetical protein